MEPSGFYDTVALLPAARIRDNLAILTMGKWHFYLVTFREPIPPGPASIVDFVAVAGAGATQIGANATLAARVAAVLQLDENEMVQFWWEAMDPVEGVLWQQGAIGRYRTRNIQARIELNTGQIDRHNLFNTFFVLGLNRDAQIEVRNPLAVAQPTARFKFWGHRFIIEELKAGGTAADQKLAEMGDIAAVQRVFGTRTFSWVVAEGRLTPST